MFIFFASLFRLIPQTVRFVRLYTFEMKENLQKENRVKKSEIRKRSNSFPIHLHHSDSDLYIVIHKISTPNEKTILLCTMLTVVWEVELLLLLLVLFGGVISTVFQWKKYWCHLV